jgi:hypothetical protein
MRLIVRRFDEFHLNLNEELIYVDNEIIMLNIVFVNEDRVILDINHREVEVLFVEVPFEDEGLHQESPHEVFHILYEVENGMKKRLMDDES